MIAIFVVISFFALPFDLSWIYSVCLFAMYFNSQPFSTCMESVLYSFERTFHLCKIIIIAM